MVAKSASTSRSVFRKSFRYAIIRAICGDGHIITVLGHTESPKWFGCMFCACPGQDSDMEHHLKPAAKAFQKHRWMLQCKDCSIKHRTQYFGGVVFSTVASPYTKNISRSMTFNLANLLVALWNLHRARIGQRNGMIFCMSGICAWITGPAPVEFRPGQKVV